jgi:hypothetical protein
MRRWASAQAGRETWAGQIGIEGERERGLFFFPFCKIKLRFELKPFSIQTSFESILDTFSFEILIMKFGYQTFELFLK